MLIKKIVVLGGTGFVGSSLCNRLSKEGYQIKILTRNREYNRENLILLPNVDLIETDVGNLNNLNQHLIGCDMVINLIGILNEKGNVGDGFKKVHVELIKKLIKACEKNGIRRFMYLSALNADSKNAKSFYLKTKGKAEELLHSNKIGMKVTSFRPSVIFGKSDSFFNRFANLLKMTPIFFPLACYKTKFAPIYVLDLVEMVIKAINDSSSYDRKFNLCGPKIYTLKDLVAYTAKTMDKKCIIIPLNNFFSLMQAKIFDFIPGKPFSTDNYLSAQTDSICKSNDLKLYNINPTPIEDIVPKYINNYNYDSFYSDL
jgi:NADH dehydrogenase|tara:strand:+ start:928 stop:1872 length:945 start_codon:yes stop_codon:yes gene_type:complete